MKRNDILILVALFALWLAWPALDRHVIKKYFFPAPPPAAVEEAPPADTASEPPALAPAESAPAAEAPAPAAEVVAEAEPEDAGPETTATLEDGLLRLAISSRGASVASAELKQYPLTAEADSAPVLLDFSSARALAYGGLAGLSEAVNFSLVSQAGNEIVLERTAASGLQLQRTFQLEDGYLLKVTDRFSNRGLAALEVPGHVMHTGPMPNLPGESAMKGVVNQGVDTLSPGGEGVQHWGAKLPRWFEEVRKEKGLPRIPERIEWPLDTPMEWVAAKNKYFAQVVVPEGGAEKAVVVARRELPEAERQDPAAKPRGAVLADVAVSVQFGATALAPGEAFTRTVQCYIGPKKFDVLSRHGQHMVDVMEFGFWAAIGKILLQVMNGIHAHLWPHNYGIAIILLTVLIRVVFWPITHKSTESMRKMQEIQPLVTAVRQQYKDNAQKQQQAIMALYKEHKVNPLGGCLPMLIQIPVFIALFVVLRSAIELRFASFLWIRDLSQPENLLAGKLPIALNLLPIIMAVTMAWQQKLTPSGGDPNQQKMMMFMPIMMLVLFYNFASGLSLYWTTNQCLMIAQQLIAQRRKKAREAAAAAR
ncbi:MAG TPA: membrane protein insertase YidC [Kiritimatiellia bacterium]|nr:membrane protein insertase YidC [Kiritimatiellia bacterium]HRZ11431.1 membrane protein insertase YidC [Kiritimatiellia bacterium]HSA17018.1 membrane protein insertase YidC [Kiritimatiellia bacterium]